MAKLVLYRVTAATGLALAAGTLVGFTSEAQLERFRWAVEGVDPKAGTATLKHPVTFKAGEEIGLEGEISKAQAQQVDAAKPGKRKAFVAPPPPPPPPSPPAPPAPAPDTTGGSGP